VNSYAYAANDPVDVTDPTGQSIMLQLMITMTIIAIGTAVLENTSHAYSKLANPLEWKGIIFSESADVGAVGFGRGQIELVANFIGSDCLPHHSYGLYTFDEFSVGPGLKYSIGTDQMEVKTPGSYGANPDILTGLLLRQDAGASLTGTCEAAISRVRMGWVWHGLLVSRACRADGACWPPEPTAAALPPTASCERRPAVRRTPFGAAHGQQVGRATPPDALHGQQVGRATPPDALHGQQVGRATPPDALHGQQVGRATPCWDPRAGRCRHARCSAIEGTPLRNW
jgi:hypothetical protein